MVLILLVVFLSCAASLGFEILFSPPLTITAGSKATATWTRELPFDPVTFTLQLMDQSGADATPTTIDSRAQMTGEVIFTFPTTGTFNVQGWRQNPSIDIGGSNIIRVLAVGASQVQTSSTPTESRKSMQAIPASTLPPLSPVSSPALLTTQNSMKTPLSSLQQTTIVNTPFPLSSSPGSSSPEPTVSEAHRTTAHRTKVIIAVIILGIIFLVTSLFIVFRIRSRRQRIRESRTAEFYREMMVQSRRSRLASEGTISENKDSISVDSTQQPQISSRNRSNSSHSRPPSTDPLETSIPDRAPRESEDSGSVVFFSLPPRQPPSIPSFTIPMHPLSSAFPSPNHTLASETQRSATVARSGSSSPTKPSKSWFKEKRVNWKEGLTQVHAAF